MSGPIPVILLLLAAGFAVFLWVRLPRLAAVRTGRVLLLLALLVMPVALIPVGVTQALHGSKEKKFCTSCHEMQVYEVSLHINDREYLPATHFQNRLVPQDTACYTCHTDYTLYGDIEAKINGLKHVAVHYFGDVPAPGELALYSPYPNDNCLQCHRGARRFEKKASHTTNGVTLAQLYGNQKSCVSKGCHDKIHDIDNLATQDLWGEAPWPIPDELKKKAAAPAADDPFADDKAPATGPPPAEDPFADDKAAAPDAGAATHAPAPPAEDPFADEDAGTPAATPDAGGDQ